MTPLGAGGAGGAGAQRLPGKGPDPVVIVAATFNDQFLADLSYDRMSRTLRDAGYEPFVFGLPGGGLTDVEPSSEELAEFVAEVRTETGAGRVDLVGHSQGGVIGRYYIRSLGGSEEVDAMVSLGAPHYGSEVADAVSLGGMWDCLYFSACRQATTTSPFLRELNEPDDTWADVDYTNIATSADNVVVPYANAHLRSTDGRNANLVVQDQCPLSIVDHAHLGDDPVVLGAVEDALAGRPVEFDC
jgi:triacylglycerol esterase/lipase EstA (alpha/beta hydrolase family)